jgi:hypothetical protein
MGRLQFGTRGHHAVFGLCVGVRIFSLHRHAMRLAVVQHPTLTFAVTVYVRAGQVRAVLGQDLRQTTALQQADLGGGVPGRAGTHRAGFQHQYVFAARANRTTVISPVMPAPTTMTSALREPESSSVAVQRGWAQSLSHKDVTRRLIPPRHGRKTAAPQAPNATGSPAYCRNS